MADDLGNFVDGYTLALGNETDGRTLALGNEVGGRALALGNSAGDLVDTSASIQAPDFAGVQRYEWSADNLDFLDGDPVSTWADVGGEGNDVTASGSARPTYREDVGGYPAVEFDGLDDFLASVATLDLTSGYETFAVLNINAHKNYNGVFRVTSGILAEAEQYVGGGGILVIRQSTSGTAFLYGGIVTAGSIQMLTSHIVSDADAEQWVDRTSGDDSVGQYSGSIVPGSAQIIELGRAVNPRYLDGYLYAVVIYDTPLTLAQREQVWDDLEARFGGPF